MNNLHTQKGSALLYVLLISTLLAIALPVIFSYTTTISASDARNVNEKKAYNLAISGMQSYIQAPVTLTVEGNYGRKTITLPEGTSVDYYQYAIPVGADAVYTNAIPLSKVGTTSKYLVVTAAIIGDTNQDETKSSGEKYFYKKTLTHEVQGEGIPNGQTAVPKLTKALVEGLPSVVGTSELNAQIKVMSQGVVIGTGTADSNGNFSFSVSRTFIAGEAVTLTATAPQKTESRAITASVVSAPDQGESPPGYVQIIDKEGNITYEKFQPIRKNPEGSIIVTSSVGKQETTDVVLEAKDQVIIQSGVDIVSSGTVDIAAGNGIIIEEGSSLTTNANGNNVGLELTATGGDIILKGARLEDNAKSNFSHITIEAENGNVTIDDAVITSTRDIFITASKNIYARNARITSEVNNGAITLTLSPVTGMIYVNNLYVSKNTTANPNSTVTCGTLASTSSLVNGQRTFKDCN
jgi:type II secretory pathway pseudopilin PulG